MLVSSVQHMIQHLYILWKDHNKSKQSSTQLHTIFVMIYTQQLLNIQFIITN